MKTPYIQTYKEYTLQRENMSDYPAGMGNIIDEETTKKLKKSEKYDKTDPDIMTEEEVEEYIEMGPKSDIGNEKRTTPTLDDEVPLVEKKKAVRKLKNTRIK